MKTVMIILTILLSSAACKVVKYKPAAGFTPHQVALLSQAAAALDKKVCAVQFSEEIEDALPVSGDEDFFPEGKAGHFDTASGAITLKPSLEDRLLQLAFLHELGHAFGINGHTRTGIMSANLHEMTVEEAVEDLAESLKAFQVGCD